MIGSKIYATGRIIKVIEIIDYNERIRLHAYAYWTNIVSGDDFFGFIVPSINEALFLSLKIWKGSCSGIDYWKRTSGELTVLRK
jgi:hypothetical protein